MPPAARQFSLENEVPLPRRTVWRLLSHTDQLNRAIGLPAVQFNPAADDPALYREARARFAGLTMRWKEYPFEWVREQRYAVTRVYEEGPIRRIDGGVELSDAAATLADGSPATHLRLYAHITPASPLGALAAPIIARRFLQRTLDYCRSFAQQPALLAALEPLPTSPGSPVDTVQLERLLQNLQTTAHLPGNAARHIPDLARFLRERGDAEVASIRPYQLAAQWGSPPDDILRLCLHATRHGLLNLSWNLMCPNCRVSKVATVSLAEVQEQFHCDLCGVTYDADFDRYVELRFAVHPGIRQASEQIYCLGGPFATPHILVQQPLAAGTEATVPYPTVDEPLRWRVLRANHVLEFDEEATPSPRDKAAEAAAPCLIYEETGWAPSHAAPPVADAPVHLRNCSGHDIVVALEKVDWDPYAVTAAKVTTMQEFRDMFSSEVLAPGQHVGIESLTLLFTDLRDSTQFYERVGDASAYGCVRRHFDFLGRYIADNNGSIVKTIGDAVMAAFYTPEDAVRAAVQIQTHVAEFNAALADDDGIVIKLGLHHGPAVAVNSNNRLDYFGRTVNIAARIGAVSKGNDLVLSANCYERPTVQEILTEHKSQIENFQSALKGIEEVFNLYRVQFHGSAEE